ncbi:hypothetical protein RJ640_021957 [Escallonia rubra]|uniref:Uncharacterized protein n=1 Tax=Escallonia rubra TaxID=112253 RepID=A0AA88UBT4_9ASTE|nr:hypothetical protein RJ640_021957 [Escallonia rubra]
MEKHNQTGEIEETTTAATDESAPLLSGQKSAARARSVRTKVPEVEVHLFRRGEGPIEVFKLDLGGWDQDQLEVRDILEKYGFKSIYAFNSKSGRGVPIRFNPKNGRSLLPYTDGSDSLINPITKILLGVLVITLFIVLALKETPEWVKKLNLAGGSIPAWVLACVVILFTRMRKRTKDFLKKRGW